MQVEWRYKIQFF